MSKEEEFKLKDMHGTTFINQYAPPRASKSTKLAHVVTFIYLFI